MPDSIRHPEGIKKDWGVGISGCVTRLTESLPKKLKGLLPSPEELEAELSRKAGESREG